MRVVSDRNSGGRGTALGIPRITRSEDLVGDVLAVAPGGGSVTVTLPRMDAHFVSRWQIVQEMVHQPTHVVGVREKARLEPLVPLAPPAERTRGPVVRSTSNVTPAPHPMSRSYWRPSSSCTT